MRNEQLTEKFRQLVENKYQIYNSLFMSLPYDKMTNIGMLLPFLYEESKIGYEQGKTPEEIIETFFRNHTNLQTEKQKADLLFTIIQYIERQVVLFDSVEDAAFTQLHSDKDLGTILHLYEKSVQSQKLEEVRKKMEDFAVRVVFTAHPTQFYPSSVQRILHDLRSAILQDSTNEIDMLLQQLGKTPFVNKDRPTPLDEATSIIYYLRYVYYDAIGELYSNLKTYFGTINPNIVQLGFWPGGDRDGNPFVTAEITLQVAEELRINILKCYYEHLKKLRRRLSFRGIAEILTELSLSIYTAIHEKKIISVEHILERLSKAETILKEEHNSVFLNQLLEFSDRVKIFGTHFASLDIRQDSRIHQQVIDEITEKYAGEKAQKMTFEEKFNWLLSNNIKLSIHDFEGITKETLLSIIGIKEIQQRNGEKGLHRYIISNSEHIKDVLNVYALFKICGYQPDEINVDIIPLFETIDGLDLSEKVMEKLYQHPVYQEHLVHRSKSQTIMLGFSDGTKDGGYLKANWEIYETKERLTAISKNFDIKPIFFDGRGGPPARGGGKTHDFYASQGSSIANHKIEITIQGQTITSVFGNKDQARYNFEQLLTAGIDNEVFKNDKKDINQQERLYMKALADLSFKRYSQLKSDSMFVPYLQKMSTLQYYGRTNIGSRPSKRGSDGEMKFEDLRAIPFVGSWAQLKQNIPGFFGLGYALSELKKQGKFESIKKLYKSSDFFKTLILNSMMSMNKSYFPLTYYMKNHPKFGDFWNQLHEEFLLSKQLTLELTEQKILQEQEPLSRRSVEIREKIVLPLLSIQQYALMKIENGEGSTELYEKMVIRSLFGNINASRNSA